jgi:hypothetical protein
MGLAWKHTRGEGGGEIGSGGEAREEAEEAMLLGRAITN